MWEFFKWAWDLPWSEGIPLLGCLFAFWYGKKWIDQKFLLVRDKKENLNRLSKKQ
jgi:hypothetical protein